MCSDERLRPFVTPAAELCACPEPRVWKLMVTLTANPIHCLGCNLEIRPEELALPVPLVTQVVRWRSVWGSLYRLWLDSGAYEAWAAAELLDAGSEANRLGTAVVRQLNAHHPCYLQYFETQNEADWQPRAACPCCGCALVAQQHGRFAYRLCAACRLAFWG